MQINEDIRDREVRVVTDGGEQLGIMSAKEALRKAEERNLEVYHNRGKQAMVEVSMPCRAPSAQTDTVSEKPVGMAAAVVGI